METGYSLQTLSQSPSWFVKTQQIICLASVTISTEPAWDLQVPSNSEGCVAFTAVMTEILLRAIVLMLNFEQCFKCKPKTIFTIDIIALLRKSRVICFEKKTCLDYVEDKMDMTFDSGTSVCN